MIPIVLLPGLLSTADIFGPQAAALASHGPVTVPSTKRRTIGEMAAFILADAPHRFALAGISMGGYIALEIMRRAPERVLRLALIDTSARPDTPEQSARRRALVERARGMNFTAFAEELFLNALHPKHRVDERLRAINRAMAAKVTVEAFATNTEAAITRPDSRDGLGAINVPTLVMVGDEDAVTPPSHSEEMAAAIKDVRLTIVPQAGHASTIEQPLFVNKALKQWLADAPDTALRTAMPGPFSLTDPPHRSAAVGRTMISFTSTPSGCSRA